MVIAANTIQHGDSGYGSYARETHDFRNANRMQLIVLKHVLEITRVRKSATSRTVFFDRRVFFATSEFANTSENVFVQHHLKIRKQSDYVV